MKGALAEKTGHQDEFTLLGYKTQVVAGTNYFMKVAFGEKVVHARVFQPLPHTGAPAEVHSIDTKEHDRETELAYF